MLYENFLRTMSERKDVGIVTPQLEWKNGVSQISCFRFHSLISEFINTSQTGFITQLLMKYDVPIAVKDFQSKPDWSSFACVLIKKEVFDDIGLMDWKITPKPAVQFLGPLLPKDSSSSCFMFFFGAYIG